MEKPKIPNNEKSRLKSLRSLNILDTSPEERFNRLTRMAIKIFDVPMALVSLVDSERQWFKSAIGLNIQETPRDISFCGHAILGNDPFIIPDTTKDNRFYDNPLVLQDPNIRFYAGCPIRSLNGSKLGTLCILDNQTRELSADDIKLLNDLALMVENELAAVELATTDDLTNIPNRRGFMLIAQNTLNLCARKNLDASLVFIDLNNFKIINDQFGHIEGDRALILFAKLMKKSFRESDVYARIGGDEFVVLFVDTSKKYAEITMKKFQQELEFINKKHNHNFILDFSYGIVQINPKKDNKIENLLLKSDNMMYKQKKMNQTIRQ